MRQRVLAVGNRFGVPPERALAILADPDLLDAGSPGAGAVATQETADAAAPAPSRHYPLPAEVLETGMVFTSSAKATYVYWAFWSMQVVLVLVLAGIAHLAQRIQPIGADVLLLFASIPAAAWLYIRIANIFDRLFHRWLEARIRRRIAGGPDAIFTGLLPGAELRAYGGFYEWDLGLVSLGGGRLTYAGERTRFSLPRAEIAGFAIARGPLAWDREHAVLVRHSGEAFLLKQPGYSWWRARRLEKKLTAWWRGQLMVSEASAAEALPPPALPTLAFSSPSRWKLAGGCAKQAVILFFAVTLVAAALLPTSVHNSFYSVLVVVAPITYALVAAPLLLRRRAG
jgi:hypothetical protein